MSGGNGDETKDGLAGVMRFLSDLRAKTDKRSRT